MNTTLFYVSYAALWVLVIFQTFVLLELMRHVLQGRGTSLSQSATSSGVTVDPDALLDTDSLAPDFQAPVLGTDQVVASQSLRGQYTLLVFISPNCSACEAITGELEGFRSRLNARLVVLCKGNTSECIVFAAQHLAGMPVLSDPDGAIADRFRVAGTPTAVLLDGAWRMKRYGFPHTATQLGLDNLLRSEAGAKEPEAARQQAGLTTG